MDECFVPIGVILKLLKELQDAPRYQELDIGANFVHDISTEIQSKIFDHQVASLFTADPAKGLSVPALTGGEEEVKEFE